MPNFCIGRETIEALASGEPVKIGEDSYAFQADSYDYPYQRIAELEAENARLTALLKAACAQINRDAKGIAELIGVKP